MELGWSFHIGPRLKVGVLSEGYAWILETPSFAKVSRRRFGESKALGSGSVRETSLGRSPRFKRWGTFLLRFIFHLGVVLSWLSLRGCLDGI